MIINDKKNFTEIISKVLEGTGYSNIKRHDNQTDISAQKDDLRYIFRCRYDIDAVGVKSIEEFSKAYGGHDKLVYVTNSSFVPAAKNFADLNKIELWDRNVIDRIYIGVRDKISDEAEPEKKSHGFLIILAILIVLGGAFLAWKFLLS